MGIPSTYLLPQSNSTGGFYRLHVSPCTNTTIFYSNICAITYSTSNHPSILVTGPRGAEAEADAGVAAAAADAPEADARAAAQAGRRRRRDAIQ